MSDHLDFVMKRSVDSAVSAAMDRFKDRLGEDKEAVAQRDELRRIFEAPVKTPSPGLSDAELREAFGNKTARTRQP